MQATMAFEDSVEVVLPVVVGLALIGVRLTIDTVSSVSLLQPATKRHPML